ncbi:MAG: GNAT family N-acetyltransferase [Catalinimonas sp.]
MDIQHETRGHRGSFYAEHEGERAAEMHYVMAGQERLIIDHTEVGEVLRGRGVGEKLVEASVRYARRHKLHILPLCPFAKKMFTRHAEWHDVLK